MMKAEKRMDSGKQFASIADLLFMERPQRTPQETAALEEVLLLTFFS